MKGNEDFIPVSNDGKNTIYPGGIAVAPGETRLLHKSQVPHYVQTQATPTVDEKAKTAPKTNPLAEVLMMSVKHIQSELPHFSDEQLAELAELEGKVKNPRKTLLESIQAEQLERSQLVQFRKDIEVLDDTSLANALADWPEGSPQYGIIEQVIEARTEPDAGTQGGTDNGANNNDAS